MEEKILFLENIVIGNKKFKKGEVFEIICYEKEGYALNIGYKINLEASNHNTMFYHVEKDIFIMIDSMFETLLHKNIIKLCEKVRGFEKISKEQFNKDFEGFNVVYEDIKLPKRSTSKSAGYDCFAPIDIKLEPNEEIKIPTGIRSYMLDNEKLGALPRSGHGFKYYLRLANTQGVIDADYYDSDNEGHIFVKLRNEGHKTLEIKKGQGMCQLIFSKYLLADGDDFTGNVRNGGFGSTDK